MEWKTYSPRESDKVDVMIVEDHDAWNLDLTLSQIIYMQLMLFRYGGALFGHPGDITEKEWLEIIDKMIWSFDQIRQQIHLDMSLEDKEAAEEYFNRIQHGLDLFAEYFLNLWW